MIVPSFLNKQYIILIATFIKDSGQKSNLIDVIETESAIWSDWI